MLTFDDGDVSFYDNAYPVLKKHNIPAVIFVITSLINTHKPFWWDEISHYLDDKDTFEIIDNLKKISNQSRIEKLRVFKNNSNVNLLEYSQLSYTQLEEMSENGISIANHSHTHPLFDQCTPQELMGELNLSINKLKEMNFIHDVFAYPNGNFSDESEELLRSFEIKMAFLFDHKLNNKLINPLRISRLIVDDFTPFWKFKLILSGFHSKILPLRKWVANWIY